MLHSIRNSSFVRAGIQRISSLRGESNCGDSGIWTHMLEFPEKMAVTLEPFRFLMAWIYGLPNLRGGSTWENSEFRTCMLGASERKMAFSLEPPRGLGGSKLERWPEERFLRKRCYNPKFLILQACVYLVPVIQAVEFRSRVFQVIVPSDMM